MRMNNAEEPQDRHSNRTRSCLLVVVISALMVAFAISELWSGSESFKTYRSLARASVLSGRVQANMLTASNAAKDFLNTRDEQHLKVFRERFQTARSFRAGTTDGH